MYSTDSPYVCMFVSSSVAQSCYPAVNLHIKYCTTVRQELRTTFCLSCQVDLDEEQYTPCITSKLSTPGRAETFFAYYIISAHGPKVNQRISTRRPSPPGMTTQVVHHQSNNNDDMLVQARAGQIATRRAPVVYENGVGKWTRCEVLGRGAHGVVYRGVVEETLESIAVKQVQMNGTGRSQLQVKVHKE